MVNSNESVRKRGRSRRIPATTPEAREHQLIALAIDRAEQQLIEGTASSQVITHYLRLGSTREKLEQARLAKENELLDAKQRALDAAGRIEELYKTALDAMRSYSGREVSEDSEDYD